MSYGSINVDTITGSGASSVIVNNGTNNVAGFTTGNNIQLLQNGGGIVFSNSSATTNSTLNDYETGTFTPTTSTSGYTISTSSGKYTKIGNLVTVYAVVNFSAVNSSGNSDVILQGLPFQGLTTSFGQPGVCREDSVAGAIFVTRIGSSSTSTLEINSYSGVANGSVAVLATGRNYICMNTYFTTF